MTSSMRRTVGSEVRVVEKDDGFRMLAYAIYTKDGSSHLRLMTQVEVWADLGTESGTAEKRWKSDAVYYSHDGSLIYGESGTLPEAAVHPGLATLGRFLCNDTLLVSDEIDLLIYLTSLKKDKSIHAVVKCFYEYGLITNDSRFLKQLERAGCSQIISSIKRDTINETGDLIVEAIIGATESMRDVVWPLARELAIKIHGPVSSSFGRERSSHKRKMRAFV